MNTHAEYRRHGYRPPGRPDPTPGVDAATSELARHRDPSLAGGGKPLEPAAKRIAWVRPTELATYAAPMVGRGIDLQAELIRRARSTPATTTRVLQRSAPHTPPTTPANTVEGPSL